MADTGLKISPLFYIFNNGKDFESFLTHNESLAPINLYDTIQDQLFELIRTRNPDKKFLASQKEEMIRQYFGKLDLISYGVWVFYPWSRNLVHLLPEDEFIELRTNRNQYKISPKEQQTLCTKRVGIIGLSVGQSVAVTMAMERSAGEFHLADFDTLDLSNLNRIRSKVHQIGESKTLLCAREMLEIDPFLTIYIYENGVNETNIDLFLKPVEKLDLLIEECDGLDIKILARYKARELGIPVLMETSDRGLLDIERFDLEPNREIIHGLIGNLDPSKLKGLSQEDKIEYLLPMVGLNAISERMKASMLEVQNSIVSWPQLASAVTMGGGVAAEMSRKILLGQSTVSGRYYIDLDEIVSEPIKEPKVIDAPKAPLTDAELHHILSLVQNEKRKDILDEKDKELIAKAAIAAPSGGNCQPWRLCFYNGYLYLIHDEYYSESFLDFEHMGTYIGFGAMVQNIRLQAEALGYSIQVHYFPVDKERKIVAQCKFALTGLILSDPKLDVIFTRVTNRKIGERILLNDHEKSCLHILNTEEHIAQLHLVEDLATMQELGDILATAEMSLLLHPQGHSDIFNKELRFTEAEVLKTKDGLDLDTLQLSKAEKLALRIANSRNAMDFLRKIGGGEAFKKTTKKAVARSSAMGIITMPLYSAESFLHAGEFLEKIWLECNLHALSFQPVTQFSFLNLRLKHGKGEGFDLVQTETFEELASRFNVLFPGLKNREIAFIFRMAKEGEPEKRSLRRDISKIIFEYPND